MAGYPQPHLAVRRALGALDAEVATQQASQFRREWNRPMLFIHAIRCVLAEKQPTLPLPQDGADLARGIHRQLDGNGRSFADV